MWKFIFALDSKCRERAWMKLQSFFCSNLVLSLQPKNKLIILVLFIFCLFLTNTQCQFLPMLIVACLLITSGERAVSLATSWKKRGIHDYKKKTQLRYMCLGMLWSKDIMSYNKLDLNCHMSHDTECPRKSAHISNILLRNWIHGPYCNKIEHHHIGFTR
jgi:hypothetical protein